MSQDSPTDADAPGGMIKNPFARGCLEKLYKNAALILILLIVAGVVFFYSPSGSVQNPPLRERAAPAWR